MGIADEEVINNMSYIFFEAVLGELGKKLQYEAICNYAGNSFVDKSWDMIMENNPMNPDNGGKSYGKTLLNFLESADVEVSHSGSYAEYQKKRHGLPNTPNAEAEKKG